MFEWSYAKRLMRAQVIGEAMRQIVVLSVSKDRGTTWQHTITVNGAHYRLQVVLEHRGGDTTQLEAVNGQRYGNEHLLNEFIAALGDRKGKHACRNPQELVTFFLDKDYQLFD